MPFDEEFRHRCETSEWIRRAGTNGGWQWLAERLNNIEARRGKLAADRLRADIKAQWALGNRGDGWRE